MAGSEEPSEATASATARNVESFSTGEMVERYARRTRRGLFDAEELAVEHYFSQGDRILDAGCGAGRTTYPLDRRGFDVTGIDISERMIEQAWSLFPDIEFAVGDVTELDYPDNAFDHALFAHNGLDYVHPVAERHRALTELRRVIAPGGTLVFSTHNLWYRFPAIVGDHAFLRRFYVANGNYRRLFRRYKTDTEEDDPLWTYMSDPRHQPRQLRRVGLEPIELVSTRDSPAKYFQARLYYAARVPES